MVVIVMIFFQCVKLFKAYLRYRVEHQTLPVEFFLNFYCILEDMNMKIGTDDPLVLTYDIIKG